MCRKGKQAFMAIELYPFRASRWVIKPHCERGGQERPSRVEVLGGWEGEAGSTLGTPALIPIGHPEVALSRVPTNRWLWSMLPLTGTCGAREGTSVSPHAQVVEHLTK